ncbi:AcrR family transcriptional regulator [Herbaspirillum sp. Sphag1AN]|uniref:TetR/AcrR family transcriptional regulator n=1 Tax=unclassified Herbaspirillum TaxID=2624150 RepID=UPI00160CF81C|nr:MULTISPECIES: TetR/AcrR family transcriptional regulator [unclassified Herbaspirillum]MBB3211818.1 AcrR family transcriptional regulator [Herbaspirillum sp. Sphag1AN]MBB3244348.1 AcrR family transcriptional regulator [Herbaspirillum sp. Sphag64]
MNKATTYSARSRGPSDHDVRTQIIEAATEYFSHYGYEKTTVSELAKAIGFSKAYIYKFFDSKQAIGEVICFNRLSLMKQLVQDATEQASSASERFRLMFKSMVDAGSDLFFHDRKLYDIAATAASEPWPSVHSYEAHMRNLIIEIIREGRESGEFERKTPLDETANAIFLVIRPYMNPLLLQYNLDQATQATNHLSSLVLRSLAP